MGVGVSMENCCVPDKLTREFTQKTKHDDTTKMALTKLNLTAPEYDSDTSVDTPRPSVSKSLSKDEILRIERRFKRSVIKNQHLDSMYLIETHPNCDLTNMIFNDGSNVLHHSVANKNSTFTVFLLQNGVNINVKNTKDFNTPLHCAVMNDDVRMTAMLLKWQANFNIKNIYEETPLDIAIKSSDDDIIALLTHDDVKAFYLTHSPSRTEYGFSRDSEFKTMYLENLRLRPSNSSIESGGSTPESNKQNQYDFTSFETNVFAQNQIKMMSVLDEEYENINKHNADEKKPEIQSIFTKLEQLARSKSHSSLPDVTPLREYTKKKSVADDAVEYVTHKEKAPVYQGWILWKSKLGHKKRYLCLKDGYLLWNNKAVKVLDNNTVDKTEKAKWKGHTSLLFIKENGIKRTDTDKFQISLNAYGANGKQKVLRYQFKCMNEGDIKYWLQGLTKHMDALSFECNW